MTTALSGTAPGPGNTLSLQPNMTYAVEGTVVAREPATGDSKSWTFTALISQGAAAANTAFVGTPTLSSLYASAGASAWTVNVTANTTTGALFVNVTGEAGKTIRWVADLRSVETADA